MKIVLIAAIGKNNELGYDNELLWHLKEDMKFFKETTINHAVVMGYKTFLSLPGVLKDRTNIVLTSKNIEIENVIIYHNIEEFINDYKDKKEKVFVIGGASIYKQFLELCDEMYLTHIQDEKKADTYFPEYDENDYEKKLIKNVCENNINYSHMHYVKRK